MKEYQTSNQEIEILIVSEAPMLTFNDNKFLCKYIFGDGPVGSYRTVPYESICDFKIDESYKTKNNDYKTNKNKII